ncbi:hypothetical protein BGX29_006326 [Mortierella sp. GBA35]|nr:hypothetical protein BGX29_006326 [Mortierella sp. GBA35]
MARNSAAGRVRDQKKSKRTLDEEDDNADDYYESSNSDTDEEEEKGGEYEVERVVGHRRERRKLEFLLKWKGYPASKNSWQEKDDVHCDHLVEAYWKRIERAGGKKTDARGEDPEYNPAKRERTTRGQTSKRRKTESPSSNEDKDEEQGHEEQEEQEDVIEDDDEDEAEFSNNEKWTPPARWTSWEAHIEAIRTISRNGDQLTIHLLWNNGHETEHPIEEAHQKLPLRLIRYYENHLRFLKVIDPNP